MHVMRYTPHLLQLEGTDTVREYSVPASYTIPDDVSMAAVAVAIGAGGALGSLDTTVLLSVEETLDALRRAQQITYQAPGGG